MVSVSLDCYHWGWKTPKTQENHEKYHQYFYTNIESPCFHTRCFPISYMLTSPEKSHLVFFISIFNLAFILICVMLDSTIIPQLRFRCSTLKGRTFIKWLHFVCTRTYLGKHMYILHLYADKLLISLRNWHICILISRAYIILL